MYRKYERSTLIGVLLLALCFVLATVSAQDFPLPLPPGTETLPMQDDDDDGSNPESDVLATRFEPLSLRQDQGGLVTIYGENFSAQTLVRLRDHGVLSVTRVSENILQVTMPQGLPAGSHKLIVIDGAGNEIKVPGRLLIVTPAQPTDPAQQPAPPTLVVGKPSVVARGMSAAPQTVFAGGIVTLQVELFNQGTHTAFAVTASLETNDRFVPSGTATALAGDIAPSTGRVIQLTALTTQSAANGINTIPITWSYRGADNESLTGSTALSVNVSRTTESSLMTLVNYTLTPEKAVPGEIVMLAVEVMNAGTKTATNALLKITTGDESVLQAGSRGDTALIGNVFPGGQIRVEIPLRVNTRAKAGLQIQPIVISYQQDGETREFATTMTIDVDRALVPEPLLLLKGYTVGQDMLAPGETFTLSAEIENIGSADANRALVTFGVTLNEDTGGGNPPAGGGGSQGTPSALFAAVGTGDTRYIEKIGHGTSITLEQDFLVSGQAKSGIYNLPISVRYEKPDGTVVTVNLQTNVLVISQPRMQTVLQMPLGETVEIGQSITLTWQLQNLDVPDIRLGNALVSAEGAEVVSGAERFVGTLKADRRATFEAVLIPMQEGALEIVLTLQYLDDMNREQSFVYTYNTEVVAPFFPPDFGGEPPFGEEFPPWGEPPFGEPETPTETPEVNWIQAFLFGLLGLGQ